MLASLVRLLKAQVSWSQPFQNCCRFRTTCRECQAPACIRSDLKSYQKVVGWKLILCHPCPLNNCDYMGILYVFCQLISENSPFAKSIQVVMMKFTAIRHLINIA